MSYVSCTTKYVWIIKYFKYYCWTCLCSASRPPNAPRMSYPWLIAPLSMSAISPMMSSEHCQHPFLSFSILFNSCSTSFQVCRYFTCTGTAFHICIREDRRGAQRLCGLLFGAAKMGNALHQSGAGGASVSVRCQFRCHNFRVLRDGLFAKEDVSRKVCLCECVCVFVIKVWLGKL